MFVKICGLTTDEAVSAALEAGADAIGFVFAPSVRRLEPKTAAQLAEQARGRALCIAVTKQPSTAEVETILDIFAPDWLQTDHVDAPQLSGRARAQWLPVYRENDTLPDSLPAQLLFEGATSGSGRVADWKKAREAAARSRIVLAGGLAPHNVAEAIRTVRPWGVDVSSGVEFEPGKKSSQKIHQFVSAARAAFKELSA